MRVILLSSGSTYEEQQSAAPARSMQGAGEAIEVIGMSCNLPSFVRRKTMHQTDVVAVARPRKHEEGMWRS
jgi:hypothetical protein